MSLHARLFRQTEAARAALWLTVGLGAGAGFAAAGQAFILSRVVNRVFLAGEGLPDVAGWLWGWLALSLLRAALGWGSRAAGGRLAGRIQTDLRDRLTAHLLALGPAFAGGERTGELVNTAVEGVAALDAYFRRYLPQLALAVILPLAVLAVVFPLDPLSGAVFLFTAPLIPLFMTLIGSWADGLARRRWVSFSRLSAHFLDVLQGLTTLKLLGRSREQLAAIARVSDRLRQTTMDVLRVAFLSAMALELVATLSTAVVAVEIGLRLLYGRMAFEPAFFILILAPQFYLPLRTLGTHFHAGTAGAAAAKRIFQVLDTPLPPAAVVAPERPPAPAIAPARAIHFHDVHVTFDGGERPALRGVTFSVAAGQTTALVGPSGGGKSTVAHLLLRFIEPQAGRITVDGRPLAAMEPSVWRAMVAWVPQQPYLFHASVADNLRLARPGASMAAVEAAARRAAADAFIRALPHGYDTLIGERGARLSGGQAQRIALARAFLKDAPILLLDEATASLDPETEAGIQAALSRLRRGRTALLIAHRLRTVAGADSIVVLAGGRVAEQGAPAELLARRGMYYRLAKEDPV